MKITIQQCIKIYALHLKGIFHLTGSLDDGMLQEQSKARFAKMVAKLNWSTLQKRLPNIGLFSALIQKQETEGKLLQQLRKTPKNEKEVLLNNHLRQELYSILKLSHYEFDEKQGFFDIGMDSLMAVEFSNRLQSAIGRSFPLSNTLIFKYSNLQKLTKHLLQLIELENNTSEKNEDIETKSQIARQEIKEMTEDDVLDELKHILRERGHE